MSAHSAAGPRARKTPFMKSKSMEKEPKNSVKSSMDSSDAKSVETNSPVAKAERLKLSDKFVESEVRGDPVDQAQDAINAEIEERIYQARRQIDDPSARVVRRQ